MAIARPMPVPAPVTIATLPAKRGDTPSNLRFHLG
jgi:hypothetical protein